MDLTLTADEVEALFQALHGSGGFQSLLAKLQRKCNQQTDAIHLDDDDLRRISEYAFDAGQGGFQDRLMRIFSRSLGPGLGR
jgi:hypothetical protein